MLKVSRSGDIFPSKIKGIPCKIRVDDYLVVPPWPGPASTCPSDADYRGYVEVNYTILDRKGYEAGWLERKIDAETDEEIINYIRRCYE